MEKKRYSVLFAATMINFIAGITYIWSVISKGLIENHNWTSKEASLPYTFFSIFFVIAMVVFGRIQDKKGPKFTVIIGSSFMGVGLILSGIFMEPRLMLLTMGLFVGTGIGTMNASTMPPATKWFSPSKKGMVIGIVAGGVGISSVFYSPMTNYLINTVGISKAFIFLGVGSLVFSLTLAQLLENPPLGYIPEEKALKSNSHIRASKDYTWRDMLVTVDFYKIWLMFALSSSAGLMIIGHASNIAKVQVNWSGGFVLVIFLSIFNALGRILGGSISDKIGRINLMKIVFIIQGTNMFVFSQYINIGLLSLGVAIAGFCYGASFAAFPSATTDFYGLKHFGINYGLICTGWGVGGIIGPMVAATIFDGSNSYNSAYIIAGILSTIAVIISFTFRQEKKDEDLVL